MSRKVLLVDADVNALGALASALRARGVTVFNASEVYEAVEQAFKNRPEVVLVAQDIDDHGELTTALRAVPEIAGIPLLRLARTDREGNLKPNEVLRADIDLVISRISEASPREPKAGPDQEIRGDMEQMPLGDLLQLLSMNRRSGILGITTTSGSGEVRLVDGEVIDAVYRRLEGEKALFRLLAEREGRFAFSPGNPSSARRITSPTAHLLMEAMHQVDEVKRRRVELSPEGEALLLDDAPPSTSGGRPPDLPGERAAMARVITSLLQIPRGIDELLDESAAPDLTILDALSALMTAGKIHRIPIADLTTPFAPAEQLPVLRSLVTRMTRQGFAPPPRLVIAASIKRMDVLANAIRRISDAAAPNEPPTRAWYRLLGTLRLGDGVELALIGLPTEELFAPTWTLALPGAAAVVRIDAGGTALEAHCETVEVMLIDAESLMGSLDTSAPGQVAALVRSALEMAAGV